MELYSWSEVTQEFNRRYNEAMKHGFVPVDGSSLFDFITKDMLLRGAGSRIGYKFPEDLRSFRSVLTRLKNENKPVGKQKKRVNNELVLGLRIKKSRRRKSSKEPIMGYDNKSETLEEQVKRLNLNPDTYF